MNQIVLKKRPFFPLILLFFITSALLSLALPPQVAIAQDDSRITLTVEAGFDGFYKQGDAVPVYVTVANTGTAVDGELRVTLKAGFNEELVYRTPVTLATQSNKRIPLPVQMPSAANSLTVELWDGDKLVAAQASGTLELMADDAFLYGVVTPIAGEFDLLSGANGRFPRAEVAYLDIADLPEITPVWNGLDMLILDDVDTADLTTEQRSALNSWLENGGQLVITGGAGWQKTTAVFSDILPVIVSDVQSVDNLQNLSKEFSIPFRDEGPYLLNNSTLQVGGELLLHQDGQPILARRAVGAGNVYFLALDPKLAPLLDWNGSPKLWEMLLNDQPEYPHQWSSGFRDFYMAETAVNDLPSLALPSTLLLAFFLFSYIIAIGPLNYTVLRRRDKLARAWITIPAISIGFAVIAYFIGFQLKGNDNIINELSVATGRMGTETVQVESLVGLYSPRRGAYDLVFDYDTVAVPFESDSGVAAGNVGAIGRSADLAMEDVRVDVGGMETFIAQSYQPMPAISGQASLTRGDGDVLLDVTIENSSDLSFENMTLIVGSRAYELDDFGENGRLTFNRTFSPLTVNLQTLPPFMPTSETPLLKNEETILRTINFYDDPIAYVRYNLLAAIEPEMLYGTTPLYHYRTDVVTLLAWADTGQIDATLADESANQYHSTLYLIDIPLTQDGVFEAK